MPIPAGAGVIAAVVHLGRGKLMPVWWLAPVWLGVLVLVGFLMVSTWRFYSFKDLNLRNRYPFQVLLLICGIGVLIWLYSSYVLFIIGISYMISGIVTRFTYGLRRRRGAEPSYEEAPEPR
jgi:CDP-diacylglycerol--serine O-phosphatidyltransferase